MTALETHIRVNQRYQEVASSKRDVLLAEEVDLALNIAQDRILQKLIADMLEGRQVDLRAVAPLIIKNKPLSAILPAISATNYEENMAYSVIPANLKYLVNARAEVVYNADNCGDTPSLATISVPEYVAVVPFPAANNDAPFYSGYSVSRTAGVLLTVLPYAPGFSTRNSKYKLINATLDYFNQPNSTNIQVYWERYREVYSKDSFIFVSPNDQGVITVSVTDSTPSAVSTAATQYTQYNRTLIPSTATLASKIAAAKPSMIQDLYDMQKANKYYASSKEEVNFNQTEDYLYFYSNESFLIVRAYIDYIRKPRAINLALNQSCELDVALPKIIDIAVEILRLDTKDANYPQTVQDAELRNKV
jgi:hypothetical protein